MLSPPVAAPIVLSPEQRLERLEKRDAEYKEIVRAVGVFLFFLFVGALLSRR